MDIGFMIYEKGIIHWRTSKTKFNLIFKLHLLHILISEHHVLRSYLHELVFEFEWDTFK
jgi:hypothetical protein